MDEKVLQFRPRATKAPASHEFAGVELNLDPKSCAESWNNVYISVQFALRLVELDSAKMAEAIAKLRDNPAFHELLENFGSHLDYLRAVVDVMGSVEARLCVTIDQIEGTAD